MNDDILDPLCGNCIFKAYLSNSKLCKCYTSRYYNKELPYEPCEYYLEDDFELNQLVLLDDTESEDL